MLKNSTVCQKTYTCQLRPLTKQRSGLESGDESHNSALAATHSPILAISMAAKVTTFDAGATSWSAISFDVQVLTLPPSMFSSLEESVRVA
jgi:hypothetical protein